VFGPYLLRGLTDLILAATRSLPVAMAALGLYGVGTSTGMVTYNSLLQAEVPSNKRGRVFAGYDMIWQTGRLISSGWAAWPPTPSASRPSTCSAAPCSCSQAPSASPGCAPSNAPTPAPELRASTMAVRLQRARSHQARPLMRQVATRLALS